VAYFVDTIPTEFTSFIVLLSFATVGMQVLS